MEHLDHNMPPRIARALHVLVEADGHEIHALRDLFPVDIPDQQYFERLGSDWIIISKDLKNSTKKAERAAILRNKIVAFYLSRGLQKRKVGEQAAAIMWHWDKMISQRASVENGLFQLPENKSRFRSL